LNIKHLNIRHYAAIDPFSGLSFPDANSMASFGLSLSPRNYYQHQPLTSLTDLGNTFAMSA